VCSEKERIATLWPDCTKEEKVFSIDSRKPHAIYSISIDLSATGAEQETENFCLLACFVV
jgi:hypothetical protein